MNLLQYIIVACEDKKDGECECTKKKIFAKLQKGNNQRLKDYINDIGLPP